MSDCLSSTDKIKINFAIESIHGISMENTTKSESKVCFKLIFLRNTLKNVFKHEVCTLKEIIESEREKYKKQSELRILNMYKEIQSLEAQVNSLSSKKRCEQESLLIEFEQKNDILNQYIESIRGQFPNTGKQIANMKSNEAPKKVSNLRERVQKALWFAKSFGIQFTQIKGADKNDKIYDLLNEKQSTNYTSLVDMEKEKVKNVLFILDSFCISDEAYHELTLQNKNMVKSYLIKQCREDVNKTFQFYKLQVHTLVHNLTFTKL